MHLDVSTIVTIILFIVSTITSAVYFVAKLEESNKGNKEFFTLSIENLKEKVTSIETSSKENIASEIGHLKEIVLNNRDELKEDIIRLERKQEESNKIKERLALQEQSEKSLHHRVDKMDDRLDSIYDMLNVETEL